MMILSVALQIKITALVHVFKLVAIKPLRRNAQNSTINYRFCNIKKENQSPLHH